MKIKITKTSELKKEDGNYYYLVNGRMLSSKNTFRKFKFISCFDNLDLKQSVIHDFISDLEKIDFYDEENARKFYNKCSKTINDYNSMNQQNRLNELKEFILNDKDFKEHYEVKNLSFKSYEESIDTLMNDIESCDFNITLDKEYIDVSYLIVKGVIYDIDVIYNIYESIF